MTTRVTQLCASLDAWRDQYNPLRGLTIARADRTRSFILPAATVERLLEKDPLDPSLAEVRREEAIAPAMARRQVEGQAPARPRDIARLRRHHAEMQRLMEFMNEEMDSLESKGR
jgi:hypothetical protein